MDYKVEVVRLYTSGDAKDRPDTAYVSITPAKNANHRLRFPWTVDYRTAKSLLARKHFWSMKRFNQNIRLLSIKTYFVAYGCKAEVPIICKIRVNLEGRNPDRETKTTGPDPATRNGARL